MEEIALAKRELEAYYSYCYVWGNGAKRNKKPFREILRDMDNFEKAYKERYAEFMELDEAIKKCGAC
nr:hypothetical protein [Helicobacter pylori]